MKKIYTTLAALFLIVTLWAQSPEKMSYQAVIRNSNDQLVQNQQLGVQISILHGSIDGTPVYVETQNPTTNANGLITFEIGTGTTSDDFSSIDWANGIYFIMTETDLDNGTNYTITGTSQLLSVPYALHSKTAENITGTITETDPVYTASEAANITASDITNLGNLSGTNTGDQDLSGLATTTSVTTALADKVDKVTGKGLSTEDYTTAEQTKLTGIATGAEVNVNADWNAVNGDAQILNKPTIPAAADGSETKLSAGTNVTITGSGTASTPYVINATGSTSAEYAYGSISGNSAGEIQNIFSMASSGITISGNQIHLSANKTYLFNATLYVYNFNENNTYGYRFKNATSGSYLTSAVYWGNPNGVTKIPNYLNQPFTFIISTTQATDIEFWITNGPTPYPGACYGKVTVTEIK